MDDRSAFTTRRVGTTGHEILAPNGTVVAWTVDGYWAAVMVAAMNEAPSEYQTASRTPDSALVDPQPDVDLEPVARRAIEYLADHEFQFTWTFPDDDPPSEQVRSLVMRYLSDGEIHATMSDMVCKYIVRQLADDHLGFVGIEIPPVDSQPPRIR
jgi:hypothetical protein